MRWYLSGPMTGLPDYNRAAFHAAAARIRAAGHEVLNPAELCPPGISWEEAMAIDLAALDTAEGVITLPGWERSRGARIEVQRARQQGLPVHALRHWLQMRHDARSAQELEYD
uniref:Putative bacteriophage-related protein n=2 Tax=Sulfobacillus thermotolerans TaxID=338644 RepID=G5CJ23_9FIRM|nr:DUF4406 domain-containing protein [Sulfobacillus thermotolerans]AEP14300.1 putative bacteriophage-related protein [Sulfobacillus thermotolerans]